MSEKISFAERATRYAEQVVAGDVVACQYVIQACQRHLDDLKRQDTDEFPYAFNPLMQDSNGVEYYPAERICKFIELLPHVKGKWARERKLITLEDWQVFILAVVFGWIDRDGLRRFKTVYEEEPRKNAKTTKISGVGLYLLAVDDEMGSEVYSAATTADQAKISWSIAKKMVEKSPKFQMKYGVRGFSHAVVQESTASSFKYLSSDSKSLDGLNVHGGLVDELHAHKTRDVYDVIETGTGSREQPLIYIITTAGSNRSGICYEIRSYAIKILNKVTTDETFFGIIYTLDEGDDWKDPAVWAKANPNYNVSVKPEDLQRKANKAITMASAQNNFLTKHLNVWVNADTSWMNMTLWQKNANPDVTMEDFKAYPMCVAADLATRIDFATVTYTFEIEKGKKYAEFTDIYLPENTLEEADNDSYSGWEKEGRIIVTDGNTIDFDRIEADITENCRNYDIQNVGYDPFQATQFANNLINEGIPMIEVRQNVANFSEPMKELEGLVTNNALIHNGCPVMEWMVSNVVCHRNAKDEIYPRKEFDENKIDGVVSLIMTIYLFLKHEKDVNVYDTSGIKTIG